MSRSQNVTRTRNGTLVDDVRESPVDMHLRQTRGRVFWALLFIVLILVVLLR